MGGLKISPEKISLFFFLNSNEAVDPPVEEGQDGVFGGKLRGGETVGGLLQNLESVLEFPPIFLVGWFLPSLENRPPRKGHSYWKPPFLGAMLSFGGVGVSPIFLKVRFSLSSKRKHLFFQMVVDLRG